MIKTNYDFKIGILEPLKNQKFSITEENKYLDFYVDGYLNEDKYSLNFIAFISLEEMLKFNLNEHIDFIKYVDEGDIVFEKNNIFDLNTEIKLDIVRYLPKSFLLMIDFKNRDGIIGTIELSFSIE